MNVSSEETASRIEHTQKMLTRIKGATGATTTILLVVNDTVSCLTEEDRQLCVDWCLQQRAEMMEINTSNTIETSYASRDKTGYARIHEALSAVQWSSAVFQGESQPANASTIRRIQTPADVDGGLIGREEEEVKEVVEDGKVGKDGKDEKDGKDQAKEAKKVQMEKSIASSVSVSQPVPDETTENSDAFWEAMQSAVSDEGREEGDMMSGGMDALSSLVSQARAVRRAGEKGTMTDEERHQAAMRVALQLASAMGLEGMGEDDLDFSDM